jgi:Domain of unknown function (DUF4386)
MSMTDRRTARLVGGLFILATVAGAVSLPLVSSLKSSSYLIKAATAETRVATGVVLILVMGAAIIAIPIVLYPVLRRFSARMAMGYVVARAIEGLTIVVSTLGALALVTLSRRFVAVSTHDAASYRVVGDTLVSGRDWLDGALGVAAFCVGALILNYALFRVRLVPRWLSAWGLAGAALYLAGGVMVLYDMVEPLSGTQFAFDVPLAVQEMVLAMWLIVKGFNVPAAPSVNAVEPEAASAAA